jgi:hypothetical protein
MYTDGTGVFPVQSFRNMQYVFGAYIYDLNAILVRAMPSKNDGAMIAPFKDILATLNTRGYAPTLNVMDNECSKTVEAHIRSNNMDIHLVPPHHHRVNVAERAIATFKEHYISACPCHSRQGLSAPTLGQFPAPGGTDPKSTAILATRPDKICQRGIQR